MIIHCNSVNAGFWQMIFHNHVKKLKEDFICEEFLSRKFPTVKVKKNLVKNYHLFHNAGGQKYDLELFKITENRKISLHYSFKKCLTYVESKTDKIMVVKRLFLFLIWRRERKPKFIFLHFYILRDVKPTFFMVMDRH
jgi:hypothetical protein